MSILARVALALALPAVAAGADEPESFDVLGREYVESIRPLTARYCLECHSADEAEGDVDLESPVGMAEIRQSPRTWRKVADQVAAGEMPPPDADALPTAEERAAIQGWAARYLRAEGYANAGDPGPVVPRRLNKAQYAWTLLDLTGHDYDPARDLPADGAAGEGFTNDGGALVMSPALLGKFLDAAKRVAAHAVPLPDGFRFFNGATRRDWTEELLAGIRAVYSRWADADGRVPMDKYLAAALECRGTDGAYEDVAKRYGINARYLRTVARALEEGGPSPILDPIRARWKTAGPDDLPGILAEIDGWRNALTRFQHVGHMKPWMVDADPVVPRLDLRVKLPDAPEGREVVVHLAAGGGERPGVVVWENPRLVRAGRPDVAIRDARAIAEGMAARRAKVVDSVVPCLAAVAGALANPGAAVDRGVLAARRGVDPAILGAWLDALGVGDGAPIHLDIFTNRLTKAGGSDAAAGWGRDETPLVIVNSSDETLHIPGELRGRGVVVHPSPSLRAAVGWSCPTAGEYRIEAKVRHAHPACGDGVSWRLELRRGAVRIALGEGATAGGAVVPVGPFGPVAMSAGDLVSLTIGPRDGNHACDLTAVDLTVTAGDRTWDLARDVTGDAMASNPHADGFGNADVWMFFREPDAAASGLAVPAGSVLARWLETPDPAARVVLAERLRKLLAEGPEGFEPADAALLRALTAPGGPIVPATASDAPVPDDSPWGLPASAFGANGAGSGDLATVGAADVAIRIPAELAAGAELAVSATVRAVDGGDDFVQARATVGGPPAVVGIRPDVPILVAGPEAEAGLKRAFAEFRGRFPAAFCYAKIVPVDEAVTLTLFHREDEPLRRLMLDDAEAATLDRLWTELRYVSRDALTQVEAFTHLMEYATQDSDPALFEPYREPIMTRAEAFRKELLATEPRHLDALIAFAPLAYRRPLLDGEERGLRDLYSRLRDEELSHEEAFALVLARILTSPAFLYRLENAPEGAASAAVSDWEAAGRLSYFLRGSAPDADLRAAAAAGKLRDPDELAGQARRLLRSPDVRRLAEEFACQWLDVYGFDDQDEKSTRHFPTFAAVKGAMHEEVVRFFTDFFQSDAKVTSILDADHAFLNQTLAEHYGIPGVTGPEWRRVDGVRKYGRGGVLAFGAALAKHSEASRTSPILRGNWISEILMGVPVPKQPKGIPILPDAAESETGLSTRQMTERHSKDFRCAGCHALMDPYGYSLEAYDAIGRFRERDSAGLAIDDHAKLVDGTEFDGLDGLRSYLKTKRRGKVERQFCKKLLGYALGRRVLLTDEPLLDEIDRRLDAEGGRISIAVDAIVRSRQFREIRGAAPVVAEAR